jgi:hypothetical protein
MVEPAGADEGRGLDAIEAVVQIDDPEIDVQTIMERIREGLVEHALDEEVEFPTFAVARARRGASPRFTEELYYQLEQANLNYDEIWVELSLVEEQVPLVGAFVNRFKRELHQLVVFYVNLLGERQVTMNDALVRTLNRLVESLETGPEMATSDLAAEVAALRREVAALRSRLEALQTQVGQEE